jgi:hypothetical protein
MGTPLPDAQRAGEVMLNAVNGVTLATALISALATASPPPGTLNVFSGEVTINGSAVNARQAGQVTLQLGRWIRTGDGMAELLLSPGNLLRVGAQSVVQLEASGPDRIRLRLQRGEALLEILDPAVPVVMEQKAGATVIDRKGLYDFDTRKKSKQMKALYAWSRARSEQLSVESAATAQSDTAGRHVAGWYWDPWASSYTYLSASGVVPGPFGWPYYSPGYAPNSIAVHPHDDSWLYGPPVINGVGPRSAPTAPISSPPTVPLTAPGEPQFPTGK